jgi:hypothetical protein
MAESGGDGKAVRATSAILNASFILAADEVTLIFAVRAVGLR